MNSQKFLEEYASILHSCERPSRYIGSEFLSQNKDFASADVRVAFVFPDKYEIGISNFGHKILYHVINSCENFMADRAYAPDKDFLDLLQKENKLLYALESKEPLKDFTKHQHWLVILFFIFIYRMGDAYFAPMAFPFYADMGFSKGEIAFVSKIFGMGATIFGGLVGA